MSLHDCVLVNLPLGSLMVVGLTVNEAGAVAVCQKALFALMLLARLLACSATIERVRAACVLIIAPASSPPKLSTQTLMISSATNTSTMVNARCARRER